MSSNIINGSSQRRVINLRAAVIVAAVAFASVAGMRKLHDRQMSGTLTFLKNTALQSIESMDYRSAQLHLSQYLALKPGDAEAREKLSLVLTEKIKTPQALEQAFRLNEDLLRKGHSNDDLRLRQARIAVTLDRMADAAAHLQVLRKSRSDEAEVWYLSAVVSQTARDTAKATEHLKRSLRCSSPVPEAFSLLASLANESTPAEYQPDRLMNAMIEKCRSSRAWEIRADWRIENNQQILAAGDFWKALEEKPSDPILNAKLVRCLQTLAKDSSQSKGAGPNFADIMKKAVEHFEARVAESPQNPAFRLHLAAILWKIRQRSEAIGVLENGIQNMPRAFMLHEAVIEYLVSENQPEKARRFFESLPAGALPRDASSYALGRILMAEQKWKQAAEALEQTLAFGNRSSSLVARARMSYALCRTNTGDNGAALEAFRTVVADSPDSPSARLGMASAWVRSGQIDLAIAEYRELQHLPGVNAVLADLLIRKNLSQPASLRSWSDVDDLLRESEPLIPDPAQRALLRADRAFASGQILLAIRTLEHARIIHADRREVRTALKRLQSDLSPGLLARLRQLSDEEPDNTEVQAVLIRHVLKSEGTEAATREIESLTQKGNVAERSAEERLLQGTRILNTALAMEQQTEHHANESALVKMLEESALRFARDLSQQNPKYEKELVRTLMRSGRSDEALKLLSKPSEYTAPAIRTESLLTLVRSTTERKRVIPEVTRILYELIQRHPAENELRYAYAELMLWAEHYEYAEQTLAPLQTREHSDGRVQALRAWLKSAEDKDLEEARALIELAIRENPREHRYLETLARVHLSEGDPEGAWEVLLQVPSDQLSLAGQVYRTAVLVRLGREAEAHVQFDQIHAVNDADFLLPADEKLLQTLSDLLLQPTTAIR